MRWLSKFFKNKFTYGIDWKNSLLKKASLLKFYENLILQDCNKLPLKIKNNELDLVFSTIIYWLKKPETLFPEINRILKKDGYFVINNYKNNYIHFKYYL